MANLTLKSNTVLSSSLLDGTTADVFDLALSTGDISIEATSLLVTVNMQVTEAFTSGEDWSLWLKVGDNYLEPLNSSDLTTEFDESGFISYQFVVESAGDGWPTLTAFVQTEAGSAFSSSAYELSYTTLSLFEEGAFGRLVEGQAIQAEASSESDADTFGFYVARGDATTATITFSQAGSVSISSTNGPLASVGLDDPTVSNVSVVAGQTLEFRLDSSETFVTVDYLCDWSADETTSIKAPSQEYTLSLGGGAGRIVDAPTLSVGDATIQDSSVTNAVSVLQFSVDQAYHLDNIFSLSEGVVKLQLIADAADKLFIQRGDNAEIAVSTDPSNPTTVLQSDLSITTIRAVSGEVNLTSYAELDTALAPEGAESLFRSGVVQTTIESQAQGVSISVDNTALQEGNGGVLTLTLDQPADSDLEIYINNSSGDLDFGEGSSFTTVTISAGDDSTTATFTAIAADADFLANEVVEITAEVATVALNNLVIEPVQLTVTDILPEISVLRLKQGLLVLDGDRNQFELTLENASDFAASEVTIDLSTNEKFAIVDSEGVPLSTLTFTPEFSAHSVYVKISDEGVAGSESSTLSGTVKVDGVNANILLPSMPLLRVAVTEVDAPFTLTGSIADDTFYSTADANTTFEGKAGNDILEIGADIELTGKFLNGVFNGGFGTDSVKIAGERSDYKTAFSDGSIYLTLANNTLEGGLQLIDVETVEFSGTSYAVSSLNAAPTPSDQVSISIDINEGGLSSLDIATLFTDLDNDTLIYRLKNGGSVDAVPEWININLSTSTIDISPGYEDAGIYNYTIESTDRSVFSGTPPSVALTVNVADVNRSPVESAAIGPQFVASSNTDNWNLNLSDYFEDLDADGLTFELSGSTPDWIGLTDATLNVAGTSIPVGSEFVELVVSDGRGGSLAASFKIEVSDSPGVWIDRAIAGRAIQLNTAELEAAYQLDPETDISVEWETSADLETWNTSELSTGTVLSGLPLNQSGPTFVRATVTFEVNGIEISNMAAPELLKSDAPVHIDIAFKPEIDVYLADAVDFSAEITSQLGSSKVLTGAGYDLSSFSADAFPTGSSFEITANAQTYLAPDVGISDVIASLRHIVGLSTLEGTAAIAADMDSNSEIGISDVISQLRQIVGLEQSSGFKAVAETADGYTDQLTAGMLNVDLQWVAMGDVDSSYTLDIV